jgi:hypothetical protein
MLSAGERAEDECGRHVLRNGSERIAQPFAQANGPDHELLQRLINAAAGIGLIKPVPVAAEDSATGEQLQLPLHRPSAATGLTDDLAQIKGLIRPEERQCQHRPPGFAEQN